MGITRYPFTIRFTDYKVQQQQIWALKLFTLEAVALGDFLTQPQPEPPNILDLILIIAVEGWQIF